MTEAEWLACENPEAMLESLGRSASARKLRLFSCACCRRIWNLIEVPECREAVEVAERYADGNVDANRLAGAFQAADLHWDDPDWDGPLDAQEAAFHVADPDPFEGAKNCVPCSAHPLDDIGLPVNKVRWLSGFSAQAVLLRDIFGNPFRRVSIHPDWLAWNDHLLPGIAQAIYAERAFDRMPILGDALEDAGCTDATILEHCRAGGTHVRGCWLLDLILGKS